MQILIVLVVVVAIGILARFGFMNGFGPGPGDGGKPSPGANVQVQPSAPRHTALIEPELKIIAEGLDWRGTKSPFSEADKLLATIRNEVVNQKLRVVFAPDVDYLDEELVKTALGKSGLSFSISDGPAN